jgi:hypothetical protein
MSRRRFPFLFAALALVFFTTACDRRAVANDDEPRRAPPSSAPAPAAASVPPELKPASSAPSTPGPKQGASAKRPGDDRRADEGNGQAGSTLAKDLLPLAKPGQKCQACFFNGRCALLANDVTNRAPPCCDYADGQTPAAWKRDESGHVAECLALALEAPSGAGRKAKGSLQPLARPNEACKTCFFNGRCALLVDGTADERKPCCDYTNGRTAGAWPDDEQAAQCLATEATAGKK